MNLVWKSWMHDPCPNKDPVQGIPSLPCWWRSLPNVQIATARSTLCVHVRVVICRHTRWARSHKDRLDDVVDEEVDVSTVDRWRRCSPARTSGPVEQRERARGRSCCTRWWPTWMPPRRRPPRPRTALSRGGDAWWRYGPARREGEISGNAQVSDSRWGGRKQHRQTSLVMLLQRRERPRIRRRPGWRGAWEWRMRQPRRACAYPARERVATWGRRCSRSTTAAWQRRRAASAWQSASLGHVDGRISGGADAGVPQTMGGVGLMHADGRRLGGAATLRRAAGETGVEAETQKESRCIRTERQRQ